jgi:hypothetical protein
MENANLARPRRRLRNGRLVRDKNPASAANARPKKVIVSHGGASQLVLRAAFDMRSRLGRAYAAAHSALVAHLGSDLTAPQAALVDQAARLRLLTQIAWSELQATGAFRRGEVAPAFDAFRRAAADERAVLALLGIQRHAREVPTLHEYLSNRPTTDGATHEQQERQAAAAADDDDDAQ